MITAQEARNLKNNKRIVFHTNQIIEHIFRKIQESALDNESEYKLVYVFGDVEVDNMVKKMYVGQWSDLDLNTQMTIKAKLKEAGYSICEEPARLNISW